MKAKRILSLLLAVLMLAGLLGTTAFAADTYPTLQSGSRGVHTTALQYLLMSKGYSLTPDGIAGSVTINAVKSFQRSAGLTVDGIAGNATFTALVSTVRRGSGGNAVKALQTLLRDKYSAGTAVDGVFGSGTESAVKAFQSKTGLTSDGIVGPATWRKLYAPSPFTLGQYSQLTEQSSSGATAKIIAFAKSKLGSTAYYNYCQRFVRLSYEAGGIKSSVSASTAYQAWKLWGVSTSSTNIPVGATVYFNSSAAGHVGIYIGNGNVIHASTTVRIESLSKLMGMYPYYGWGYQSGVKPN
ncbi:MAG: peptidoglycan-binding protein [Eubacteriales bacterium]